MTESLKEVREQIAHLVYQWEGNYGSYLGFPFERVPDNWRGKIMAYAHADQILSLISPLIAAKVEAVMNKTTPYDSLTTTINGMTLGDTYLIGERVGMMKVAEWVNTNWLDSTNLKQWRAFLKQNRIDVKDD